VKYKVGCIMQKYVITMTMSSYLGASTVCQTSKRIKESRLARPCAKLYRRHLWGITASRRTRSMQEEQGASRNLYEEHLGNDSEQERLYIHPDTGRGEAGKRALDEFIDP
jgi:hypothetical protein